MFCTSPLVIHMQNIKAQTKFLTRRLAQLRGCVSNKIPEVGVRRDILVQIDAGLAGKTRDTLEDIETLYNEMKTIKEHIEWVRL